MKKEEQILYTDGHEVTVTESGLHVRSKWYSLSGITRHGLTVLPPMKVHGILLTAIGVLMAVAGGQQLFPGVIDNFYGIEVSVSQLSLFSGLFLTSLGAWLLLSLGERYAVSITTAEGEKHVVVSRKREYVTMIVHALNDAFFAKLTEKDNKTTPATRQFQVSGR